MPPFLWLYSNWGKEKINKVETGNMSESTAERCIPPCRCLRIVMEELRRRETVICSDKLWKSHVDVSPSWCKEEEKQWENVAVSHSPARALSLDLIPLPQPELWKRESAAGACGSGPLPHGSWEIEAHSQAILSSLLSYGRPVIYSNSHCHISGK